MLLNVNTVPNLDSKQSLIFLLRHGSEDRMPTACSLYQISWQKTHTQVKKWLETSVSLPSATDSIVAVMWPKKLENNQYYNLMQIFNPFHWPRAHHVTYKIMVRSWAMSSYYVSLQIIFCSCVNETTLFSCLRLQLLLRDNGRLICFPKIFIIFKKQTWWSNDYWTTRQSQNIMICQCLIDQLFASAIGFGK